MFVQSQDCSSGTAACIDIQKWLLFYFWIPTYKHEAKLAYKSGYLSVVSQQISYGIKCVFSGEKAETSVEYF